MGDWGNARVSMEPASRDPAVHRRVVALGGAAVLVVLAAIGVLVARREESFEGRRLSVWVRDLESDDSGVRTAAARTLASAAPSCQNRGHCSGFDRRLMGGWRSCAVWGRTVL